MRCRFLFQKDVALLGFSPRHVRSTSALCAPFSNKIASLFNHSNKHHGHGLTGDQSWLPCIILLCMFCVASPKPMVKYNVLCFSGSLYSISLVLTKRRSCYQLLIVSLSLERIQRTTTLYPPIRDGKFWWGWKILVGMKTAQGENSNLTYLQ